MIFYIPKQICNQLIKHKWYRHWNLSVWSCKLQIISKCNVRISQTLLYYYSTSLTLYFLAYLWNLSKMKDIIRKKYILQEHTNLPKAGKSWKLHKYCIFVSTLHGRIVTYHSQAKFEHNFLIYMSSSVPSTTVTTVDDAFPSFAVHSVTRYPWQFLQVPALPGWGGLFTLFHTLLQCVGFLPAPRPCSAHYEGDAFFYCFSPVSCKAGGRGLLWISHAPCRRLPRGRHNILLWRPGPSLNSPTSIFTPLLCLHHLISSPSSPRQFELTVLHNTPIHWWL